MTVNHEHRKTSKERAFTEGPSHRRAQRQEKAGQWALLRAWACLEEQRVQKE